MLVSHLNLNIERFVVAFAGVILMEGGNADDLKVLEMDPALLEAEMNKPAAEGKTETSSDKTEGASGPAGMTVSLIF